MKGKGPTELRDEEGSAVGDEGVREAIMAEDAVDEEPDKAGGAEVLSSVGANARPRVAALDVLGRGASRATTEDGIVASARELGTERNTRS